jgi:adenine-specific DNA-methyltransferase
MGDQKQKREKVGSTSGDVVADQVAKLRSLFPECVSEGKIDFGKLRATLGDAAEAGPGRFTFTWAGKDDAVGLLQTPSRGTLLPCPAESVNFDATGNAFIEGDNLEVLKLLFKPYFGKVKLIYIDPPYNTGQDFVYPDNYTDPLKNYLIQTKQIDDDGNLVTNKIDRAGRIHSGWLSMMYPRLFIARQLLNEEGVICISIDDNEVHHLRLLMNEVFGEENFIAQIIWKCRQYPDARATTGISTDHEYLLVYARTEEFRFRGSERDETKFTNPDDDERGPWMSRSMLGLATAEQRPNLHYELIDPKTRTVYRPPAETGWRYGKDKMKTLVDTGCILFPPTPEGRPREKKFRKDMTSEFIGFPSIIQDVFTAHGTAEIRDLFGYQAMDFPKPTSLIQRIVEQTTKDDDLILDFFAGSGTTGHAVMAQNRKDGHSRSFLLIQLQEPTGKPELKTIADVGKERLRRVIKQLTEEGKGGIGFEENDPPEDLGFKAFKLSTPNIEQWVPDNDRDPEKYAAKLGLFDDPLVADWKPENVLWEVALREGFSLKTQYALKKLANGNSLYVVTDPGKDPQQTFFLCLDDEVRADLSKHQMLTADSLLICRDNALDDTAAANLALQCRLKTI